MNWLMQIGIRRGLRGVLLAASLAAVSAPALPAAAPPADARAIMQKVEDFDDGDDLVSDIELTLTDRQGNRKVRRMRRLAKNFGRDGRDEYAYSYFYFPQVLEGMTVLTFDYHNYDQEDETWVYIPQLGRTKRMTSADKTGRLMGSDINYGDLVQRDTNRYDFRLLGEEQVRQWHTWLIEFVPRREEEIRRYGYLKGRAWVDKASFRVVRAIFWKAENNEVKYFEIYKMKKIAGIWTPLAMSFMLKKGAVLLHRTDMKVINPRYGQKLGANLFDPNSLERKLPPELLPAGADPDAKSNKQNAVAALKLKLETGKAIAGIPVGVLGALAVLAALLTAIAAALAARRLRSGRAASQAVRMES
jgi:hypothetical protein